MAKIYPNNPSISSSCNNNNNNNNNNSSEREIFTIWLKSLVFHGNGCTIFNSEGDVVYRVDNYQQKCSTKVYLMDSSGEVLFSINRKRLRIFECLEGYKWKNNSNVDKERPWFQLKNAHTVLSKDISCSVTLKNARNERYKIIGVEGKSTFKIIDHFSGKLLAEAVEKQSSEGVSLGEDVLTLMVEPKADQSLIMALVTVYGLINNKL